MLSCGQAMTPKFLRELRNMQKPPPLVTMILEAVATLLGVPEPHSPAARRKVLLPNIVQKLQDLELENVTWLTFKKAKKFLANPNFNEESVRGKSPAAAPLVAWCLAVSSYLVQAWPDDDINGVVMQEPGKFTLQNSLASLTHGELIVTPNPTTMTESEAAQVANLQVSRPGVGSIKFHGPTDVRGVEFEKAVHLENGEVLLYPHYETKPQPGTGLNKKATVTLYQCWPPNGEGYLEDAASRARYRAEIQQMTEQKNARFIDYDCITGVWKFSVDHF